MKTEQVLQGLIHNDDVKIDIYALPLVARKMRHPLFAHRPNMESGAQTKDLAKFYGISYTTVESVNCISDPGEACLILGAGLLPSEFVMRVPTVNCHPGLIPAVRGLDAFKWAMHDSQPLGVSLHLVDKEVDAGKHLKSIRTPVFSEDTIESLAQRHYETEIQLLINFRRYLKKPESHMTGIQERPARMRMPIEIEKEMLAHADTYINKHRERA